MDTDRKKSKPSKPSKGGSRTAQQPRPEGPNAADDERTASVPLEPAQRHPRHSENTDVADETPRAWDDRAG